jgi:hypothetical protein
MDLASMARLANASKAPLGLVGGILDQMYIDEQRLWRKAEVVRLMSIMVPPEAIVTLLVKPWRCTRARTSGRCRGVPHRFATLLQCPLHHPGVPSQEKQKKQLAEEREAVESAQKRRLAMEREDADKAEVLARHLQRAQNRQDEWQQDKAEYAKLLAFHLQSAQTMQLAEAGYAELLAFHPQSAQKRRLKDEHAKSYAQQRRVHEEFDDTEKAHLLAHHLQKWKDRQEGAQQDEDDYAELIAHHLQMAQLWQLRDEQYKKGAHLQQLIAKNERCRRQSSVHIVS